MHLPRHRRLLRGPAWILGCSLLSCQSTPFTYVSADAATVGKVSESQASHVVDILFVVDNSGSMADKQITLQKSTQAFIAQLAAGNVDYHLGLLTTDLFAPTDGGRLRSAGTNPAFLSAPPPGDPNATMLHAQVVAGFNAAVAQLGIGGSSQESALGAVTNALSPTSAAVSARNAGFLRTAADLAVVIVTDEDDCAPLPANYALVDSWTGQPTRCYDSQQFLYTTTSLVDQFAAIKGGLGKVRVGIITGGTHAADGSFVPKGCHLGADNKPNTACGCWSYAPDAWFCTDLHSSFSQPCTTTGTCPAATCPAVGSTCDTPRCTSTSPHRYLAFLSELGERRVGLGLPAGTFIDSICQGDYHDALISVAQNVVVSNCFTLSAAANRQGLGLRVAHPLPNGAYAPEQVLQRFGTTDASATCRDCSRCSGAAWELVESTNGSAQICLTCGTSAQLGDLFSISNLSP
jgi:hypothetical protein